eukprot:1180450-Prorocentrum_minimum.AAC.6
MFTKGRSPGITALAGRSSDRLCKCAEPSFFAQDPSDQACRRRRKGVVARNRGISRARDVRGFSVSESQGFYITTMVWWLAKK